MQVIGNFHIEGFASYCVLKTLGGSEEVRGFSAFDRSQGRTKVEQMALNFASKDPKTRLRQRSCIILPLMKSSGVMKPELAKWILAVTQYLSMESTIHQHNDNFAQGVDHDLRSMHGMNLCLQILSPPAVLMGQSGCVESLRAARSSCRFPQCTTDGDNVAPGNEVEKVSVSGGFADPRCVLTTSR